MKMFNQIDAIDMFFSGWYCVSVQQSICNNENVPKQTHCSKQTILQIGSRNSRKLNGRRTTNPKVFDLHRKNNSKNIMQQTDPHDLQEPELCATKSEFDLLMRLRRIVRCAKRGARLGCTVASYHHGCRNALTSPCMNML